MNTGLVDTADPLANELKIDMREKLAMLDPETSQFMTILNKLPTERARSFKVEWLDDRLVPRTTALAASAASDATNLTVTTNTGSYFKPGDIVRIVNTGEPVRVSTTGASAITVVRAIDGSTAASAQTTGDGGLVIVGGSNAQGATLPLALITQRTAGYNYTQITRNAWRFTETANATEWYAGGLLAKERKKKFSEHKTDLENTAFFGARSYSASDPPRHTAGGLIQYISTNVTNSLTTLTSGGFNDFMRTGLQFGSHNKVMFASPLISQVISEFLADNWVRARPDERVWGAKVDAYISAVYGVDIPVIVKRQWGAYGTPSGKFYSTKAFLVDMEYVQWAPLRDSALLKNREANDADEVAEEYLCEASLKVEREETHALLDAVVG